MGFKVVVPLSVGGESEKYPEIWGPMRDPSL